MISLQHNGDLLPWAHGHANAEVPDHPPLVAIEILSPDDRIGYVVPKLDEYRRWGVAHIWVADPEDRKLLVYGADGLHEVEQLELPALGIVLTKNEIFG